MRFNKGLSLDRAAQALAVFVWGLALAGCASAPFQLPLESQDRAKQFGLVHCDVSVPLSTDEVVRQSRLVGNPIPEKNVQWQAILSALQVGDELRSVNCTGRKGENGGYYFALFRNGKLFLKFYPMFD